ncbi:hypothetical protein SAY86_025282 [Trapa natans]|uniref:C2H2-type domain-containing protein n=1 Tax=Trapa natans TaxID=22666 RepID=A0AAN7M817_TRANT|nr:hypothetical protein SAY86_025282 [Trapa natans]
MGGHMRSHFAKLPLPPKLSTFLPTEEIRSELLPQSHTHENKYLDHHTHHDSFRSSSKSKSKVLFHQEPLPTEHASYNSDSALSVEDVALCLMMLSRNWWKLARNDNASSEHENEDGGGGQEDDYEEEEEETFGSLMSRSRSRSRSPGEYRYKCVTCSKCFRSYQALGGHRSSHTGSSNYAITTGTDNRKSFECPYCDRVFDSGQALGGHKKVHYDHHLPKI